MFNLPPCSRACVLHNILRRHEPCVSQGIALSADRNYKVLGAAYPWVARRLLTEKSPELRETLQTLLYKNGRFQFARLESLLQQAATSPARQE